MVYKPSSSVSGCGPTSPTTSSLERYAPYLKRSDEEDVPWMLRVAEFRKGVNQSALPVGLEYNVQLDHRTGGWVAQTLPVGWNGILGVLNPHLIPPRYDSGRREIGE